MIAALNENRMKASAATLNGKIYVVGGFSGRVYVNSAEVYNPKINQRTSIKRMVSLRTTFAA
jgi:hypothetical protein